jgi:hypothetical protein
MTRWVSSTWCRHMGPTPPRAADRWGHGCLSIFPVCACPDQTRRLQIIPPPYPLPLSLLHHLAALLRISAYPLPLSLSLLPHLAALLRISARFATCRFGVCPSDCLRLRRPNRRPLLACYRPDPHGPKALGLAWRRWPRSAVTPGALLLLCRWLHRRKVLCSRWTLASSLTLLLCQRVRTPDPTLSCSYSYLLHPVHLHAVVLLVDITTVQALVITTVVTLPVKGTLPMTYSCLFS